MRRVSPLPAAAGLPPVPSQPEAVFIFIFFENEYKYCQISSEAGLAPSGSPAALLPEDSARLSRPGGLFLFIFSENKYCQISSEAGLAPSGSPAALLPGDSAHPSCPGGLFYLFSPKINTARFHPRRTLPPRAPLRLCYREIRRIRRAPAIDFYLFSPKINTASFHPRRVLPPQAPLRLCRRKIRRNRKAFSVLSLSYFYALHKNTAKLYNPPTALLRQCGGGFHFHYTRNGERIYRLRRKMLPPFGGPICVKPADSNMASAMRLV